MGSTFSYGKRYTATALLNIVTEGEDDDGHRGGQSFITDAEADDLRALAKEIGRHESQLLDQMFGGKVRSFDELEQGNAVLAVRNTMLGIKRAQQQKKAAP
jgi:hypothetical protein